MNKLNLDLGMNINDCSEVNGEEPSLHNNL